MAKTERDRLNEMKQVLEAEWDRLNNPKNGFGLHADVAWYRRDAQKRGADIAVARAQIGAELERLDAQPAPRVPEN